MQWGSGGRERPWQGEIERVSIDDMLSHGEELAQVFKFSEIDEMVIGQDSDAGKARK